MIQVDWVSNGIQFRATRSKEGDHLHVRPHVPNAEWKRTSAVRFPNELLSKILDLVHDPAKHGILSAEPSA